MTNLVQLFLEIFQTKLVQKI